MHYYIIHHTVLSNYKITSSFWIYFIITKSIEIMSSHYNKFEGKLGSFKMMLPYNLWIIKVEKKCQFTNGTSCMIEGRRKV